jgi:hypothetical protein
VEHAGRRLFAGGDRVRAADREASVGTGAQIGALPETPHSRAVQPCSHARWTRTPAVRYVSALGFASALEAASQGRG